MLSRNVDECKPLPDGAFKFYPTTATYETKIAVTLVTLDSSALGYVVDAVYAGAANPLVVTDNSTDIWKIKVRRCRLTLLNPC